MKEEVWVIIGFVGETESTLALEAWATETEARTAAKAKAEECLTEYEQSGYENVRLDIDGGQQMVQVLVDQRYRDSSSGEEKVKTHVLERFEYYALAFKTNAVDRLADIGEKCSTA